MATFSSTGRTEKLWRARTGRADHPALIAERDPADLVRRVSPDGKWLAYARNVAASRPLHMALYVQPWRDGGSGRWEIASDGSQPVWRSDSRELFFMAPGGRLMAQRVEGGRAIGAPAQLCTTEALEGSGVAGWSYGAAPDGQRFLVKVSARRPSIIVMSWPSH